MNLTDLKYEVQRIDGTWESIVEAVNLLVEAYKHHDHIPKSIEYGFFEEYYKSVIDWIGQGQDKNLQETFAAIRKIILQENEFVSPFAGANSKKRFGAQLNFISDFMEIYLRSDLQIKDEHRLKGDKPRNKRLRKLLFELMDISGHFTNDDLASLAIYAHYTQKTMERDLKILVELLFVRKRALSPRKIVYELTNRAYHLKNPFPLNLDNLKYLTRQR